MLQTRDQSASPCSHEVFVDKTMDFFHLWNQTEHAIQMPVVALVERMAFTSALSTCSIPRIEKSKREKCTFMSRTAL